MLLAAKVWPPKMEIFLYFEIGLAIGIRRILVRPIGQTVAARDDALGESA